MSGDIEMRIISKPGYLKRCKCFRKPIVVIFDDYKYMQLGIYPETAQVLCKCGIVGYQRKGWVNAVVAWNTQEHSDKFGVHKW